MDLITSVMKNIVIGIQGTSFYEGNIIIITIITTTITTIISINLSFKEIIRIL